ncbi:hypothetical protein RQP46_010983 [Phenoliferia psychrophenolica]
MMKAFPRTLSLPSLRLPLARQNSTATGSVHESQGSPKVKATRDVAAQQGAAQLLDQAIRLTEKRLRTTSPAAPPAEDDRATFVRRPRDDRSERAPALPRAGGRWTSTTYAAKAGGVATEAKSGAPASGKTSSKGYPGAVSSAGVAARLLEHRKLRGIADDHLVREITRNKPIDKVERDRAVSAYYDSPRSTRETSFPPFTPKDRSAATTSPSTSKFGGPRAPGGPRKQPASQKRAAGGKRSAPSSKSDAFAHMPMLQNPAKVHYPTLDVASLIKADLESRALRLKAAVGAQTPKDADADADGDNRAVRLAEQKERQGDYSKWFSEVVDGPEAVKQARRALGNNPSMGLVQREALLKAVNAALPQRERR